MATIHKREGKNTHSYRVMIRVTGHPTLRRTFRRLSDAKSWAQETELRVRRGDYQSVAIQAKKRLLNEAIDRYVNEVLCQKALNTQRTETTYIKFWKQELGMYALNFLSPEIINKKIALLLRGGDKRKQLKEGRKLVGPRSRKTVKLYIGNLNIILKHTYRWGWIGSNPIDRVTRITNADKARVRFLDDNERKALLKSCKRSPNPQLYPIVFFALCTGARKSEILKLTLKDLCFERQVAILWETKNKETRKIPIVTHLMDVLKIHLEWREQHVNRIPGGSIFLFPREDGQLPIDIRKAWENARDKAGIIDFRFHDLRHSAASYLAMSGASQLEIAEVLGHKTLQMVKRYSHLSEDHTRDVVERMACKVFDTTD